jgi:hypothetical protein
MMQYHPVSIYKLESRFHKVVADFVVPSEKTEVGVLLVFQSLS